MYALKRFLMLGVAAAVTGPGMSTAVAASPVWQPTERFGTPGANVGSFPVVDAAGTVTILSVAPGDRSIRLDVQRRTHDGEWGSPLTISNHPVLARGPRLFGRDIVVGEDGTVTVVWIDSTSSPDTIHVMARSVTRDGVWMQPETVASFRPMSILPSERDADVAAAVDMDGRLVVAWTSGGSVMARTRASDGTWGDPHLLSGRCGEVVEVAANRRGVAAVVWSCGDRILGSVRDAGGTWSAGTQLSRPRHGSLTPTVAVDGDGTVTAAWSTSRRSGPARFFEEYSIESRRHPVGAAWSSRQQLAGTGIGVRMVADRGVARTTAVVSTPHGLRARVHDGRRWGTPSGVSPPDVTPGGFDVASDGAAGIVVAWRPSGRSLTGPAPVTVTSLIDGVWSSPTVISAPVGGHHRVALGPGGIRAIAWNDAGPAASRSRLRLSRVTRPSPRCPGVPEFVGITRVGQESSIVYRAQPGQAILGADRMSRREITRRLATARGRRTMPHAEYTLGRWTFPDRLPWYARRVGARSVAVALRPNAGSRLYAEATFGIGLPIQAGSRVRIHVPATALRVHRTGCGAPAAVDVRVPVIGASTFVED